MRANIYSALVDLLVSIPLNNPAGISVIPVLENVPLNIDLVLVAELVLMLLNNSAGIDVIPVQPVNVF